MEPVIECTVDDIWAALGVPPTGPEDEAWAVRAAAAATGYVNGLPIVGDLATSPRLEPQAIQGCIALGVALYLRRPHGAVGMDGDTSVPAAIDSTIARLLRVGYYQKPVTA